MLQNTVYVPSNHFDNLYLVSPLIRLVTFHSPQIYLEMCLQYSWDFTCIENSPSKRFMSTLLAQNVFLISSSPMNLQNSIAIARHDQKNTLLQKCMYTPAFHLKRRRICTQITMHSDGGGGGKCTWDPSGGFVTRANAWLETNSTPEELFVLLVRGWASRLKDKYWMYMHQKSTWNFEQKWVLAGNDTPSFQKVSSSYMISSRQFVFGWENWKYS